MNTIQAVRGQGHARGMCARSRVRVCVCFLYKHRELLQTHMSARTYVGRSQNMKSNFYTGNPLWLARSVSALFTFQFGTFPDTRREL